MLNQYSACCLGSILIALIVCARADAAKPTEAELADRDRWVEAHFDSDSPQLPFSFQYGGKPALERLGTWKISRTPLERGEHQTRRQISWSDPDSGLKVKCDVVTFDEFPAVEWVMHFENAGKTDTPLIEKIQALDLTLKRGGPNEFVVHYANGGQALPDDFKPISETMEPNEELKFGSTYDLSSGQNLPFFGAEHDGQGLIAAVGWSGSWMVRAQRDAEKGMQVQAGMYASHTEMPRFFLRPGERIRTPRMLLLFWKGDRLHGHNMWRQLLLENYVLRRAGKTVRAPTCSLNWGLATADEQIAKINWFADHKLPVEVYWIDAGWCGDAGLRFEEWGVGAANRIPRPDLYPKGMKQVADAAHQRGLKLLLWFWPHRAVSGVEIGAQHPDWVVPGDGLDHGTPEVNQWMIQHYGDMIQEFGLDIFRQDGHPTIPADESPDRTGLRQIRYVEGFYDFWDHLLGRFPQLIIDNCAAGGRKIDIETIQRSIPLWRSDMQVNVSFDPVNMQGQTYGISFWVPLSSGVASFPTPYSMRSGYSPGLNTQWHVFQRKIDDKGFDFAAARRLLEEYISVRECFYGDYYPLTEYSLSHENWMAWQFHRDDLKHGLVQVFRRKDSPYQVASFKLHGLDPNLDYIVTDRDSDRVVTRSGRKLMDDGVSVDLPSPDSTAILTYRQAP